MARAKQPDPSLTSEDRIKEAARKVFTRKGYAATRTRDIAEEAGINLALLNYYFRSKEKLFQQIMMEKVQQLFGSLLPLVEDPATTLPEKIILLSNYYIDTIGANPDLPFFVLYEIRNNPTRFVSWIEGSGKLKESVLFRQLKEANQEMDPNQLIINLFSLLIFPFLAQDMLHAFLGLGEAHLKGLIEDRKTWVPKWLNQMIRDE